MSQVRERVFAWVAVVVVVVSAGALSTAAIVQQLMSNNQPPAQDTSALNCTDTNIEPTYAVPPKYIVDNNITKLEVKDIKVGGGAAAKAGDCLVAKYYGTLAASGTMFDEDFTSPDALAFRIGQGQVIPGWDQGLLGMKVGGERRLAIPAELAYGGASQGNIPANSALVFYVILLGVK